MSKDIDGFRRAILPKWAPEMSLNDALEVSSENEIDRLLHILLDVLTTQRMQQFLALNFSVAVHVDHDAKLVETRVIERPVTVGPALTGNQLFQMRQQIVFSQATNPDALMKNICKILGQEPPSLVLSATEADAQREAAQIVTPDGRPPHG